MLVEKKNKNEIEKKQQLKIPPSPAPQGKHC